MKPRGFATRGAAFRAGSAMSTAQACTLGGAPNCVAAPENIFDAVDNCAWVSIPMTVSQAMAYSTPAGWRRCQSVAS